MILRSYDSKQPQKRLPSLIYTPAVPAVNRIVQFVIMLLLLMVVINEFMRGKTQRETLHGDPCCSDPSGIQKDSLGMQKDPLHCDLFGDDDSGICSSQSIASCSSSLSIRSFSSASETTNSLLNIPNCPNLSEQAISSSSLIHLMKMIDNKYSG